MAQTQREREDKYDVGADFAMPDLEGWVPPGGRVDRATVGLQSTYFDTDAHALLGQHVTLRRREGDIDSGWQLKVPDELARTEIRLPLTPGNEVPAELSDLVWGLTLGRPLRPVAILRTTRRLSRLIGPDDSVIVEVADDLVHASVLGHTAVVSEWREVELELGSGTEELLRELGRHLKKSGARASASSSKLGRALADPVPPTPPASGAAGVVGAYLAAQYQALAAGDLALRRGSDVAGDPIHPTRVASRRLRSTLRTFGTLFDAAAAQALDAELAWYAGLLGDVRDRQVQRARFADAIDQLPPELILGPVAAHIEQHLLSEQLQHRRQLEAELDSDRYRAMLTAVAGWATQPPVTPAIDGESALLVRYVKKARRKVSRRLEAALGPNGDDQALHGARKAAKRARYAIELTAPVLGRKSSAVAIAGYRDMQDVLGEHQDSVVAADLLRRLGTEAGTTPGQNGFTYGLLYAREQRVAEEARTAAVSFLD